MDVKSVHLCSNIEDNLRMYIQCPHDYTLESGKYARLIRGLDGTNREARFGMYYALIDDGVCEQFHEVKFNQENDDGW